MRDVELDIHVEETVASHLATARWEDVPQVAREQAARALVWWLGTALEGVMHPEQSPLRRFVADQKLPGNALVIGSTQRTTPELAGLYNGSAGKIYEHEDKYWMDDSIGFAPGCCVVPAALSAAETVGAVSGRDLLMAIAIGLDLSIRLHRPLGMEFVPGRATSTSTFVIGNYAAAATAARVLSLDARTHMNTLGLAHGQASGNFEGHIEGRGVSAQAGFAVRNGITAARLASMGAGAARAAVSGPAGLYSTHFRHADVNLESIIIDLGQKYWGADLAFKAYPCGIVSHPALDAARAIHAQLDGRAVRSIHLDGPASIAIMAEPIDFKRSPNSSIEAQFSIPWGIACVIRDGDLTIDHYNQTNLGNGDLRRLAGRVEIALADDMVGSALEAVLDDGSTISVPPVLMARGRPENPLTTPEIVEVLIRAGERVGLCKDAVARAADLALSPEEFEDARQLTGLLTKFRS